MTEVEVPLEELSKKYRSKYDLFKVLTAKCKYQHPFTLEFIISLNSAMGSPHIKILHLEAHD